MNVGLPGSRKFYAQEFKVPKNFAIITEITLAGWAAKKIQTEQEKTARSSKKSKKKKLLLGSVTKNLVINHGLFGALLPNQGPPPLDFKMPKDWEAVAQQRKNKAFDPWHLIYPLFPENDEGDPLALDNDGACMIVFDSVCEHREKKNLPPVTTVSAQTSARACCICRHVCVSVCASVCLCVCPFCVALSDSLSHSCAMHHSIDRVDSLLLLLVFLLVFCLCVVLSSLHTPTSPALPAPGSCAIPCWSSTRRRRRWPRTSTRFSCARRPALTKKRSRTKWTSSRRSARIKRR